MKGKEQRYQEAIERNLLGFTRFPTRETIYDAKHAIGIRQDDTRFDLDICKVIRASKFPKGNRE